MYVLQTSRFSRVTAYIQHLKDLVANVSAYPLSSPFAPRAGPCNSPERREQQRILLPYKQSLMVGVDARSHADHAGDPGGDEDAAVRATGRAGDAGDAWRSLWRVGVQRRGDEWGEERRGE